MHSTQKVACYFSTSVPFMILYRCVAEMMIKAEFEDGHGQTHCEDVDRCGSWFDPKAKRALMLISTLATSCVSQLFS